MHRRPDRILIAMVVVARAIALVLGGTYLVSARGAARPATSSNVAQAAPPTTILKTLTIAAGGDVVGDRDVGAFIDENGGDADLGLRLTLADDRAVFSAR